MRGAHIRIAIVAAVAAGLASAARAPAQELGANWRLVAGGGFGWSLSGHDLSETWDRAGLVLAGIDHRATEDVWLGVGWTGAWLERGAPGGDTRHALLIQTDVGPGDDGFALRLGAGLAISTITDVERPPPGGPPGDATVSTGGTMGGALSAGLGWFHRAFADRIALGGSLDFQLQRVGGHTLSLLGLAGRVEIGL